MKQSTLAGAVRAEDGHHYGLWHYQIHTMEGLDGAVSADQTLDLWQLSGHRAALLANQVASGA